MGLSEPPRPAARVGDGNFDRLGLMPMEPSAVRHGGAGGLSGAELPEISFTTDVQGTITGRGGL
jgi:hypothetical protein